MSWDKHAAAIHARQHAFSSSHHRCGEFVRKAVLAGGITLRRSLNAKDFGPALEAEGFRPVKTGQHIIEGDIAIIQPYPGGNVSGHIAIFDGSVWFSDFKQHDMWSGPGYRRFQPAYVIYRKG